MEVSRSISYIVDKTVSRVGLASVGAMGPNLYAPKSSSDREQEQEQQKKTRMQSNYFIINKSNLKPMMFALVFLSEVLWFGRYIIQISLSKKLNETAAATAASAAAEVQKVLFWQINGGGLQNVHFFSVA